MEPAKYTNYLWKCAALASCLALAPIAFGGLPSNKTKGIERIVNPLPIITQVRKEIKPGKRDDNISSIIKEEVERADLPDYITPSLVIAIAKVESGDNMESSENHHKISPKRARGLLQITPVAWKQVHGNARGYLKNVFDPLTNIRTGLEYLDYLDGFLSENYPGWSKLSREDQKRHLLATYNVGPGRYKIKGFDLRKMSRETKKYVPKVIDEERKL
jgi:soluble lytic murein transglycosylase-like protein